MFLFTCGFTPYSTIPMPIVFVFSVIFVYDCRRDPFLCLYHYHAFVALPSYYARGGFCLQNILNHGYRGLAADRDDLYMRKIFLCTFCDSDTVSAHSLLLCKNYTSHNHDNGEAKMIC